MTTPDSIYSQGAKIVATFPDAGSANKALTDLHHAGFRDVWLGVTRADATSGLTTVESNGDSGSGVMESLGRFFSGEGAQSQALHQTLTARGLSEAQALKLESTLPANSSIVVVAAENDATEAGDILASNGGRVESGAIGAAQPAGSPALGTATTEIDSDRRVQLRAERLFIDKRRVSSGEAQVTKEVISQQQSVDVPVFHEVLFIERRPVSGTAATSRLPIGQAEEIHIPLTEERVNVQKQTFVTEEIEIGKRKIEATEHVSDTLRHEELRVDTATTAGSTANVAGTRPL